MARIRLVVNTLFWFVTEKVYLKTEREVAEAKKLAKDVIISGDKSVSVTVDYDVKEVKDTSTGKKHHTYVWYKTTRQKVTIQQEIAKIAKLINKPQWLIAYTDLIKDIKDISPDDIVILIIPEWIYVDKSIYTKRAEGISAFYKLIYQVLDKVNNVIVWKDKDNYIMTHNKKILMQTTNGSPGFQMESTALRSIYSKLTQKKVVMKDDTELLVDKRFLKNPYYEKLINISRKTKNIYLMSIVKTYIDNKEGRSVKHELLKGSEDVLGCEDYIMAFNYLDITLGKELKTDIDKFIYKIYTIAYLKITGNIDYYIDTVYDEDNAITTINVIQRVLKTRIDISSIYDSSLRIEDGDYIKTEVGSVQLVDNNTPHMYYMEEEEGASASSDSPMFEEDYEVQFEYLRQTQEGEIK
jgi:hypothetical protein